MNISADTNVLVRAVMADDPKQGKAAAKIMRDARLIAVASSCVCELVWVLQSVYKLDRDDIDIAITALLDAVNVVMNHPAVEAGLAIHRDGGDFADGLIAYEGKWLGGETFVSFDKKAVALLSSRGIAARLLS